MIENKLATFARWIKIEIHRIPLGDVVIDSTIYYVQISNNERENFAVRWICFDDKIVPFILVTDIWSGEPFNKMQSVISNNVIIYYL